MKSLIKFYVIILIVLIYSCKKGSNDNPLIGTWQLTESYISIGGPGEWKKADKNTNSYFQIKNNGTLAGNSYSDYKTYVIKSSTIITFYKADGKYEDYQYTINNSELTLSPAGPIICIEGCASRYQKNIPKIVYSP